MGILQRKEQSLFESEFFESCARGDIVNAKKLVDTNSYLLNCRSPEGWTGIIVAAFWQRRHVVEWLLELGANPNDTGFNGTTVLMYAKTKIVEDQEKDFALLQLLIDAGARLSQRDRFDKDIFDYLDTDVAGEKRVYKFLKDFL